MTATREEMLRVIYEKIMGTRITGTRCMIGDVLYWICKEYGEWTITIRGDGVIDFGEMQEEYKLRSPIDNQSDKCILFIYNLCKGTKN